MGGGNGKRGAWSRPRNAGGTSFGLRPPPRPIPFLTLCKRYETVNHYIVRNGGRGPAESRSKRVSLGVVN